MQPIGRLPWKPWMVGGGLLLTLSIFLLAWSFSTFPGDRGALKSFQDNQSEWLDTAALAVTSLSGWAAAVVMIAGAAVYLALRRRRTDALIVLLSAVPMLAAFLLKEPIGRARPEYFITGSEPGSLSFPSGHAVFAMIFGGLLIMLVGELTGSIKIRRTLQIGVGLFILAVGASRVYLGVHWPSDVLGGYLFGVMALLGLVWLRNRLATSEAGPQGLRLKQDEIGRTAELGAGHR